MMVGPSNVASESSEVCHLLEKTFTSFVSGVNVVNANATNELMVGSGTRQVGKRRTFLLVSDRNKLA